MKRTWRRLPLTTAGYWRDALLGSDACAVQPRPPGVRVGRCCAEAAAEVLVARSLRAGATGSLRRTHVCLPASDRGRSQLPRRPSDLCRKRRSTRLSMDDRPPLSLIGIRYQQFSPVMTLFAVRYWLPVLITAILVCVPWIDRATRFSLRTLLIATTLVAVILGAIVYAAK